MKKLKNLFQTSWNCHSDFRGGQHSWPGAHGSGCLAINTVRLVARTTSPPSLSQPHGDYEDHDREADELVLTFANRNASTAYALQVLLPGFGNNATAAVTVTVLKAETPLSPASGFVRTSTSEGLAASAPLDVRIPAYSIVSIEVAAFSAAEGAL